MTQKQIADATGLSRQRIAQLTNGYKKGKYYYPALLESGLHYTWNEGELFYYENAVAAVNSRKSELIVSRKSKGNSKKQKDNRKL